MKRTIATIIIAERILLREGIASLLHQTFYKVIASVASVSEIGDLKLPAKRPLLTILGLSGDLGETTRMVQDVRRIVHGGKVIAIGERIGDFGFQEILNSGVDGILFNVGSREAMLKALDLAFLDQQIIIIGQPAHSGRRHVGAPPLAPDNGTTPRSMLDPVSKMTDAPRSLLHDLRARFPGRTQRIMFCLTGGSSDATSARSYSTAKAAVKACLGTFVRKISTQNTTPVALWTMASRLQFNPGIARWRGGAA